MRSAHPRYCFLISSFRLPFPRLLGAAPTQIPHSLFPSHFHARKTLALLLLPPLMASENLSTDDAKSGFSRPEMYKENLAGTIGDSYDRHVFLCYKNHLAWPPRVEASDSDPLPKLLAATVKKRRSDFTVKTKVTVCETQEEAGLLEGDVLIFPEMIKYRGLTESNIESFVEDVMVDVKPWTAAVEDEIAGSYVFVCAHGSRDVRCGVCGPVLIEKLNEEIELRGLKGQVSVMACSHVGGHKYAGNLIIYSTGPNGNIMGHWYGYVTPNDVPEVLDQHIAKGEIIKRLWRGQMGPSVEGAVDKKLTNGEHISKENNLERVNLSKNENVGGCCQGAKGTSCCMTASFEQNKIIGESTEAHQKQHGRKSNFNWAVFEERKVGIAVAAVGVAVAAAVAFKFYRRSG